MRRTDAQGMIGRLAGPLVLGAALAWITPALPLWAADSAVDFDGVDGYVEIASPADFAFLGSTTTDSTIAFWGKFRGVSNGIIGISGNTSDPGDYFRLGLDANNLIFVTFNETSKDTNQSTQAINLNEWVHVVFSKSNGQYTFYINGAAAGTFTTTQNPVTEQRLVFGARTHTALDGFTDGALDEVRVYNRVLSQAEITAQYNNGLGHYGEPEAGLVGGWHFDDTADDYSGNGHAGTLQGGTTWVPGLVTAPAAPPPPPPPPPSGDDPFQESSGQVVIEAEHHHAMTPRNGQDWTLQTGQAGFSDSGYVQALPEDAGFYNAGYVGASPELRYDVEFETTGTYYVWIRGYAAGGTDDSIHAGIDGSGPASADRMTIAQGAWSWSRNTMDSAPSTVSIGSPGLHTIHFWMREDGFRLDKILLRTDGSAVPPSGTGPSESPRATGGGGGSDTTDPVITITSHQDGEIIVAP